MAGWLELLTAVLPINKQDEGESGMQEELVSAALETGPDKVKGSRSTPLLPTHTSASGQSEAKRKAAHGHRPPLTCVNPLS